MTAAKRQLESLVSDGQDAWSQAVAKGEVEIDPRHAVVGDGLREQFEFEGQLPPNGQFASGTEQYEAGISGRALQFDGESELTLKNKLAAAPEKAKSKKQPARFQPLGCTDRYSFSFWLRPDEVKHGVILSRQSPSMGRQGTSVELRDGHLVYNVISRWIAGAGVVETQHKLEPGKWVHVAVTNDGSQRATRQHIYIDGHRVPVRVLVNTNSNTGAAGKAEPLRIGNGPHGKGFRGAIDELRYYDRELSPEEVLALSAPTSIREIASLAAERRTAQQAAKLHQAFLGHSAAQNAYRQWTDARQKLARYRATLPTTMVMLENPTEKKTFVRTRGVYNAYGEEVQRGVPEILPGLEENAPRNRLGFAQWLVSGRNPLTARVTVNRFWQKYFGTGLVKTSEDFGVQGEKPSHPELLDWLATEFVRSGWNVAAMQRLIVTSATYRQSSRVTKEQLGLDPDNRLLARGARIRLSGPVLRDQALFTSGLLVDTIGGPSVSPYQPDKLWIEMSMGQRYRLSKGGDLFRRSLYTVWKRTVNPPSMAILDAADREACWVRVKRTNTPLQALTLLNETAFVEAARHLAARMMREGGDDPIGFGFQAVTARIPGPHEREVLEAAYAAYRANYEKDPAAAKQLLSVGTTPVASDLDPCELAAFTTLSNVLLNLDEVVTNE